MAGMSKGKKTAMIAMASIAGVFIVGSAATALAVGAALHWEERERENGGRGRKGEGCGTCDGSTGATPEKRGMQSGHYFDEATTALAATLGMSAGELQEELAGGRKLVDIASERGVSLDLMVGSVIRVTEEILDQEVAEGDLNPEMVEDIMVEVADYTAWSLEHGGVWLQREHAFRH